MGYPFVRAISIFYFCPKHREMNTSPNQCLGCRDERYVTYVVRNPFDEPTNPYIVQDYSPQVIAGRAT